MRCRRVASGRERTDSLPALHVEMPPLERRGRRRVVDGAATLHPVRLAVGDPHRALAAARAGDAVGVVIALAGGGEAGGVAQAVDVGEAVARLAEADAPFDALGVESLGVEIEGDVGVDDAASTPGMARIH